ncbi:MAG: class I SAM-dependent methyltransferase [Euryarchaeota archaeon]|nr:class I SAM-dependent methyltransferase [Euryarchaeota archaeon]
MSTISNLQSSIKKYDTICCFEVLEHILDYQSFLKNMAASLEERGRLIVSTPNIFGLRSYLRLILRDGTVFGIGTSDDSHIRFFSVDTLSNTLIKAGFRIVKVKTFSTSRIPCPSRWGGSIVTVCEKS